MKKDILKFFHFSFADLKVGFVSIALFSSLLLPAQDTVLNSISVVQKNILFETGKYELKSESVETLDSLFKSIDNNKHIEIEINGYTDDRGKKEKNILLSENRAKAASDYFITKGVDPKQITYHGNGVAKQVSEHPTDAERKQNRRVEITIRISTPVIHVARKQLPENQPSDKPSPEENKSIAELEVGKTMVLKNLNFIGGTANLLPEARPVLENLIKTMKDNPTLEIEIDGHVCCFDDMPLSIRRAQAVYAYLIKKGIAAERMTYKGFSRNKPLVEDDSDENSAMLNRRVEIKILKK